MTGQVGPRGVTEVSDTAVRDIGVSGLAVCLTGCKNQRLVLRN
jgi:hypothetical protein